MVVTELFEMTLRDVTDELNFFVWRVLGEIALFFALIQPGYFPNKTFSRFP